MTTPAVDYDALAAAHGGKASSPEVDYDALARSSGGFPVEPVKRGYFEKGPVISPEQQRKDVMAESKIAAAAAPGEYREPSGFGQDVGTAMEALYSLLLGGSAVKAAVSAAAPTATTGVQTAARILAPSPTTVVDAVPKVLRGDFKGAAKDYAVDTALDRYAPGLPKWLAALIKIGT